MHWLVARYSTPKELHMSIPKSTPMDMALEVESQRNND
jgi:hypothetical protein